MPTAPASSLARPSYSSAPITAPRSGPDMRGHSIGGPACSSKFGFIPGMTSRAAASPFNIGRADIMRSTAVWLAESISIVHLLLHLRQYLHQPLVSAGRRAPIHVQRHRALPDQT